VGFARRADGTPIALGVSHRALGGRVVDGGGRGGIEIGLGCDFRFAAYCTDPCDGAARQGTNRHVSILLAYRNDASTVFRRLIRFSANAQGRAGSREHATKGLPAMMMALAAMQRFALRSGAWAASTLLPEEGRGRGARIQTIGARFRAWADHD